MACDGDNALMSDERDLLVEAAVHTIQGNPAKATRRICSVVREGNHFHSTDPDQCCRQCATTWIPKHIRYEGIQLKTKTCLKAYIRTCGRTPRHKGTSHRRGY